jgi:hypothetical protein
MERDDVPDVSMNSLLIDSLSDSPEKNGKRFFTSF